MRTTPGRSRQPPAISALFSSTISSATGATVAFSCGGGLLVGVIVFMVGNRFQRLALDPRKPSW